MRLDRLAQNPRSPASSGDAYSSDGTEPALHKQVEPPEDACKRLFPLALAHAATGAGTCALTQCEITIALRSPDLAPPAGPAFGSA